MAHTGTPVPLVAHLLILLFGLVVGPAAAVAQTPPPDLSEVSIEDLMRIEITSAARKEQRAGDVAAAVFVITRDDIRRSGMTNIPDLLRLAPGVQVAQINANKWAVSVRGFNSLYANKLLVLVDGRSVYNRLFSGVYWDVEDLMIDDIDRIEVIRGPGAAIWGANAVNGVINIVTKPTVDTKGGLFRAEGGRSGTQGAVRYGGTLGTASYRLYAQWTGRDESLIAADTRAADASQSVTTGFRADGTARPGAWLLEGAVTIGRARGLWPNLDPRTAADQPIANVVSDMRGGHLLSRWTHTRAGGASLQVQSSIDLERREEPPGDYDRQTFDIDTQYHAALGARHDLVVGAGYRFSSDTFAGHVGFSLTPSANTASLVTAFVQDEIAFLDKRLAVLLGSQVQYDSDAGAGVQPTARVIWKGLPGQRLWAATSRALRTPSLYERWLRAELPPPPTDSGLPLYLTAVGNPDAKTETLVDVEAGYRLEIGQAASIDVTGFLGRYEYLRTSEPEAPVVQFVPSPRILVTSQFGNLLDATTRGVELVGNWAPIPAWRLAGSYTAFDVNPRPAPASQDPTSAREDGSAPRAQWQLRSLLSVGGRGMVDLALFRVGALKLNGVPAYTRADLNAEWRITPRLSVMVIGQNLLDAAHRESAAGAGSFVLETQVPRSASVRLRWSSR